MQANGYLLPANETPNHSSSRSGDGRGSGEKAKPSNRVRLNGNIARRNPGMATCAICRSNCRFASNAVPKRVGQSVPNPTVGN